MITEDLNKKIAKIQYNSLNLPRYLQFCNGNSIHYFYDASGAKQRVVYQTAVENVLVPLGSTLALSKAQISRSDTVDYCGNKIYDNGKLRQIFNTEGYWTPEQGGEYFCYLKDHLGSNRVVLNASGEIAQVNHYYAFGMEYGEGKDSGLQNYKYNGKELDNII